MHAWKPIRGSIDSFCSMSLWSATAQKSAWSVDRPRPAIRNERPPAERSGGGVRRGEARRDDDDDEEEQAEQGADRGTPSLSYHRRPIGPRRHTARLFFLPLSRARQINTGECRRRTIDQKPIVRVRFVAPRPIASRIGLTDEGKGEGSARGSGWIGLRSILRFFKIAFRAKGIIERAWE